MKSARNHSVGDFEERHFISSPAPKSKPYQGKKFDVDNSQGENSDVGDLKISLEIAN